MNNHFKNSVFVAPRQVIGLPEAFAAKSERGYRALEAVYDVLNTIERLDAAQHDVLYDLSCKIVLNLEGLDDLEAFKVSQLSEVLGYGQGDKQRDRVVERVIRQALQVSNNSYYLNLNAVVTDPEALASLEEHDLDYSKEEIVQDYLSRPGGECLYGAMVESYGHDVAVEYIVRSMSGEKVSVSDIAEKYRRDTAIDASANVQHLFER